MYKTKEHYWENPARNCYCENCGRYSGKYPLCRECYYQECEDDDCYCEYCGEYSGDYPLCRECYNLACEDVIIKNEEGEWVKNIRLGNEYKFYDPNKKYTLKTNLLSKHEMFFFNIVRKILGQKYVIIPQVNLQSIVKTDTVTRNDELFRNIDFMIYYADKFIPFLAIEINGRQHYTNEYWKERDRSVKSILSDIGIPLFTIKNEDLINENKKHVQNVIKQVIDYLNSNSIDNQEKTTDLNWAENLIKKLGE